VNPSKTYLRSLSSVADGVARGNWVEDVRARFFGGISDVETVEERRCAAVEVVCEGAGDIVFLCLGALASLSDSSETIVATRYVV
jgi:hypothetical protein